MYHFNFESSRQTFDTTEIKSTEIFIVLKSILANCRNVQPGEVFFCKFFSALFFPLNLALVVINGVEKPITRKTW